MYPHLWMVTFLSALFSLFSWLIFYAAVTFHPCLSYPGYWKGFGAGVLHSHLLICRVTLANLLSVVGASTRLLRIFLWELNDSDATVGQAFPLHQVWRGLLLPSFMPKVSRPVCGRSGIRTQASWLQRLLFTFTILWFGPISGPPFLFLPV